MYGHQTDRAERRGEHAHNRPHQPGSRQEGDAAATEAQGGRGPLAHVRRGAQRRSGDGCRRAPLRDPHRSAEPTPEGDEAADAPQAEDEPEEEGK